jgi:primary-amine oxidase
MGFINAPTTDSDSATLLPLDLFVRFDLTGRDKASWNVTGWYRNGTFYPTTEDLRAAINSPLFQPLPINVDGDWTSTDKQGEDKPFDELPPPIAVSEGSSRYSVDYNEQFVSWSE